jgi:tetratricopeptide (TPR) repeat protein
VIEGKAMNTMAISNERQATGQGPNPTFVRKGGVFLRFLGLLSVAFCWSPAVFAHAAEEIHWHFDYGEGRQEAKSAGLPLLLYFATEWSPQCKKMESTTLHDQELAGFVNKEYVAVKLDGMREKQLLERLQIQVYPTLILASPDGKIHDRLSGSVEVKDLREHLQKLATAVANPEWMTRDQQEAAHASAKGDYAKAVKLLRPIADESRQRPVQVEARRLLKEIEEKAEAALTAARQLESSGKPAEAIDAYQAAARTFAGTTPATAAERAATALAEKPEVKLQLRQQRASTLLEQAKSDFHHQQWVCCYDRCTSLATGYADLPEANEANQIIEQIKANPDWMKSATDNMADRLGELYLAQAEAWIHKGEPQMAVQYFEKVIMAFPNSRHAEVARNRLGQIQIRSNNPLKFLRNKFQGSSVRDVEQKP